MKKQQSSYQITDFDQGIFTTASTNLIYAQNFMALIALYHPDLVIKTWMTFVVYQAFNLITGGIVMFGNVIIPLLNKFSCKLQAMPVGTQNSRN